MTEMPFMICRDREVTRVQQGQRETEDQRYVGVISSKESGFVPRPHQCPVFDGFSVSYV